MFFFCLDLDELDELQNKNFWISRNRFNLYSFFEKDHWLGKAGSAKENILAHLRAQGFSLKPGKVLLLTQLRTFGYVFNPVSFYFIFDGQGAPQALVAEVGNTFGEQKLFTVPAGNFKDGAFHDRQSKHYYISPFMDLDTELDFYIKPPDEKLEIRVDDYKNGEKIFISVLTGEKHKLSAGTLFWYAFRYPLQPQRVIFLIHLHAFILWLKKLKYHRKEDNPELQKEVSREYQKK